MSVNDIGRRTQPPITTKLAASHPPSHLDRSSVSPLYRQLAARIRAEINSGVLASGEQLESELELAARYGVSPPTTRLAIEQLIGEGMLVRRRGNGTTVVRAEVPRPLQLTSLFDDLEQSKHAPGTVVLSMDLGLPTVEVAATMMLPPDGPVLRLLRLRTANREPLAILENFLPAERVDLGDVDLGVTGLYRAMRAAGVRILSAKQRIGARPGTAQECRLLREGPGSPMITMERLTHDDSGLPVEWGRHVFRANRYEFTMTLIGGAVGC